MPNNTESTAIFSWGSGVYDGVMAGVGPIVSDVMGLSTESESAALEIIWTGNPAGQFSLVGQVGNFPWEPIDMDGLENPVGTAYAGSLTAVDLEAEDIGRCVVDLADLAYSRIFVRYLNRAGAGTCRVRIVDKRSPRHLPGEAGWRTHVDLFEDVATWAALNAASVNLANSVSHVWGQRSIAYGKAADGAIVIGGIAKTLPAAINLRRAGPASVIQAGLYLSTVTDVAYAFIRLGTTAGNYTEWRVPVARLRAGWQLLDVLFGDVAAEAGNGWDPTAVSYVATGVTFGLPATVLAGICWDHLTVSNIEATAQPDLRALSQRAGALGDAASVSGTQAAQLRSIAETLLAIAGGGSGKTVLDDFEAQATWTVGNVATVNKATSTIHVWGTSAVTFDKAADGAITIAYIQKTLTAVDLSPYHEGDMVVAALYLNVLTDITYVVIRLGTDNANYNEWRVPLEDLVVGWNVLTIRFGDCSAIGGVGWNPDAVTYMAIGVQFGLPATALASIVADMAFVLTDVTANNPVLAELLRNTNALGPYVRGMYGGGSGKLSIEAMDSHALWTVGNVATTNKADSHDHVWGTHALQFDKAADGAITSAWCYQVLPAVLNLSAYNLNDVLTAYMKVASVADISYAWIRLGTDAGNYNEWRMPVARLGAASWQALQWRLCQPSATVGNGWNSAAVAYVAIGIEFIAAASALVAVYFDQILVQTNPATASPAYDPEMNVVRARARIYLGEEQITNTGAHVHGAPPVGTNLIVIWSEGGATRHQVNGDADATAGGWIPENCGRAVRADNLTGITFYGLAGTFDNVTYYREV